MANPEGQTYKEFQAKLSGLTLDDILAGVVCEHCQEPGLMMFHWEPLPEGWEVVVELASMVEGGTWAVKRLKCAHCHCVFDLFGGEWGRSPDCGRETVQAEMALGLPRREFVH